MARRRTLHRRGLTAAAAVCLGLSGCRAGPAERARELVLASTTSTEDSGLFEVLIPAFERAHPYRVKIIAVGTGQAMELGRRRDADVLLVHSPYAESVFVAQGYGIARHDVMYNDFVIVGPPGDPAGVRAAGDVVDALRRIAGAGARGARFVSRGDDSGTHRKERQLWREAGIALPDRSRKVPRRPETERSGPPTSAPIWYLEAGQGMGDVLRLASERGAYTLTDRATYLFLGHRLRSALLLAGDPRLFNQYGVIPIAHARNPAGAAAFAEWITGAGQELIGRYGVERFGSPLFVPNAGTASGRGEAAGSAAPGTMAFHDSGS